MSSLRATGARQPSVRKPASPRLGEPNIDRRDVQDLGRKTVIGGDAGEGRFEAHGFQAAAFKGTSIRLR